MRYFLRLILLILLLPAAFSGCKRQKKKELVKRVTLWRKDKIPYGTYYAFEHLKYYFPEARVQINNLSPADYKFYRDGDFETVDTSNGNADPNRKRRTAYMIIGRSVIPNEKEIDAILNYVGNGNQVFISAYYIGDSLLSTLKVKLFDPLGFRWPRDSLELSVFNPLDGDSLVYRYPGLAGDNSIIALDSQYTTVLGHDSYGRPDFVKFSYKGGGALYLHFAPLAFSNFFLLHKDNKAYLDNVLSYLPQTITDIKWDDYFRYPRKSNFSALGFILANQSLRWAFWLMLLLFAFIYLFESKRRQRLIPARNSINNSSLDFVKTIGRLYYQRKDNANLAGKMSVQLLDYLRTRYNLSANILNEEFVERVAQKTGYDREALQILINEVNLFQQDVYISDENLMHFSERIEAFYKQA